MNIPGGCLAFGKLWVCNGSSVYGYDQFTGAQSAQFTGFGQGADPRFVQPFEGGLLVACDDQRIYTIDPVEGVNPAIALAGNVTWLQTFGDSVYVGGDNGVQRICRRLRQ